MPDSNLNPFELFVDLKRNNFEQYDISELASSGSSFHLLYLLCSFYMPKIHVWCKQALGLR